MKSKYHNPEGVKHNKVPRGWRFLTHEESKGFCEHLNLRSNLRVWIPELNRFSPEASYCGNIPEFTYITKR